MEGSESSRGRSEQNVDKNGNAWNSWKEEERDNTDSRNYDDRSKNNVLCLADHFRGIASPKAGDGTTFLLWNDVWNGYYLINEFPRLFSFARKQNISLIQYLQNQDVATHFHIPLSMEAMEEFRHFNNKILQVADSLQGKDVWYYIWGNATFHSKKFYMRNFSSITPPAPFSWIWKSKACKKIKVFVWLMFRDRINSRNLLRRRNYNLDNDDYNCVLYDLNIEETTYHLLFECSFSQRCWEYLNIHWDHSLDFFSTLEVAKEQPGIQSFMEVFSVAAWEIWKQRNAKIFRHHSPSFNDWKRCFRNTLRLQLYRMNFYVRSALDLWLNTL